LKTVVVAFGSLLDSGPERVGIACWIECPGPVLGTASRKALRIIARIATERINRVHVA